MTLPRHCHLLRLSICCRARQTYSLARFFCPSVCLYVYAFAGLFIGVVKCFLQQTCCTVDKQLQNQLKGEVTFTGEIKDNKLRIGNTEMAVYNPDNKTKVPDVLFYENAQVSIHAPGQNDDGSYLPTSKSVMCYVYCLCAMSFDAFLCPSHS